MEKEGQGKSNLEELRERKLNKKNAMNSIVKQYLTIFALLMLKATIVDIQDSRLTTNFRFFPEEKLDNSPNWVMKRSVKPENCSYKILPNQYPKSVGQLRYVKQEDLREFNGEFPAVSVKAVYNNATNDFHTLEIFARCNQDYVCYGFEQDALNKIRKDENEDIHARTKKFVTGLFEVAPFSEELTLTYDIKAYLGIDNGTGTIIHYKNKFNLVTAAHVLPNLPRNFYKSDVLATNMFRMQFDLFEKKDGYAQTLSELSSHELLGKKLQLFFSRNTCDDKYPDKQFFVYEIIPDKIENDELSALVPDDADEYLAGVSGAGIYYQGKYVGTFHSSLYYPGESRIYFAGTDSVREVLGEAVLRGKRNYIIMKKSPEFKPNLVDEMGSFNPEKKLPSMGSSFQSDLK